MWRWVARFTLPVATPLPVIIEAAYERGRLSARVVKIQTPPIMGVTPEMEESLKAGDAWIAKIIGWYPSVRRANGALYEAGVPETIRLTVPST
jgi:hypothetical protein